jgi:hypothetical protein
VAAVLGVVVVTVVLVVVVVVAVAVEVVLVSAVIVMVVVVVVLTKQAVPVYKTRHTKGTNAQYNSTLITLAHAPAGLPSVANSSRHPLYRRDLLILLEFESRSAKFPDWLWDLTD